MNDTVINTSVSQFVNERAHYKKNKRTEQGCRAHDLTQLHLRLTLPAGMSTAPVIAVPVHLPVQPFEPLPPEYTGGVATGVYIIKM